MKAINVKCMVRVRPLSKKEIIDGAEPCVIAVGKAIAIRETQFTYDYVFPENVEQIEVYNKTVAPMVMKLFDGFHQTVFAYGQTGSGKTFTMGGEYGGHINHDIEGIIPRVAAAIFEKVSSNSEEYSIVCKVSYFELYKEEIRDLLKPSTSTKLLQVREQPDGQTIISDLSKHAINSAIEMLEALKEGNTCRSVGATEMNAVSSRSHACFTVTVEQQHRQVLEDSKCSMLRLIDLAGSERLKRTKAEGNRKEEGVQINLGLLALGNVISGLSDGASHISYRDSKLTRILKDSLGGNSHTLMIACVSPADTNYEESLNTLRYADRARKIKNKPIQNRDPVQAELIQLRKELQMLRANGGGGIMDNIEETEEYLDMKERYDKELEDYKKALHSSTSKNTVLILKIDSSEKEREKMEQQLTVIRGKAKELKMEHMNMTLVCENLENMEEDPSAAITFKALRQLHSDILEIEQRNNKRKISFAVLKHTSQHDHSDISDDDISQSEDSKVNPVDDTEMSEIAPNTPDMNAKLFASHKLNNDLLDINAEIETKEYNLQQMMNIEENHQLIKAKYERQIVELTEQLDKIGREKTQLVVAMNSPKPNESLGKGPCSKKDKLADQRRQKIKELEEKMGQLERDRKEKERLVREKVQREKVMERMKEELHDLKKKKVDLVKKAKEEHKRFNAFKMEKDKEIKTLCKADRRQKVELQKMERQNERIQNVLRVKSHQAKLAEKKLKEVLQKKNQAIAAKAVLGRDFTINDTKEKLANEIESRVWGRIAKDTVENLKKERAALTIKKESARSEKERNYYERLIKQKSAELGQSQRSASESDSMPSATSAKSLPFKDLSEARKIIEYLFDVCVDKGVSANIYQQQSTDYVEQREKLKNELMLMQQQARTIEMDHREELQSMQTQKQVEVDKAVKAFIRESHDLPKPAMLGKRRTGIKREQSSLDHLTPFRNYQPSTPADDMVLDPSYNIPHVRQSKEKKCSCKSDCSRRNCSCKKVTRGCDEDCNCDPNKCKNRTVIKSDPGSDEYGAAKMKIEFGSDGEENDKENVTVIISPERASILRENKDIVPDLDITTIGLGSNRKVHAFTPKKKKLFADALEPTKAKNARKIKLPTGQFEDDEILTPRK